MSYVPRGVTIWVSMAETGDCVANLTVPEHVFAATSYMTREQATPIFPSESEEQPKASLFLQSAVTAANGLSKTKGVLASQQDSPGACKVATEVKDLQMKP